MTIAILAMQGAFLEHGQMLDRLGVEHFEIRKKEDLDRSFDGLILPGGESTVMRKLLIELNIYDILKKKIEDGLPVFGTCAGLILLAEQVIMPPTRRWCSMLWHNEHFGKAECIWKTAWKLLYRR